jgi:hypothetical protein
MAAAASLFPDEMDEHDVGRLQVRRLPRLVELLKLVGFIEGLQCKESMLDGSTNPRKVGSSLSSKTYLNCFLQTDDPFCVVF